MEDARQSAKSNGLSNCQFLTGAVEEHVSKIALDKTVHTFIMDPPRKGISEAVIQTLLQAQPKQIIYISCNPATLARDLERLDGYKIQDIRVIDMFPQTQHIETAVRLTHRPTASGRGILP